MLRVFAQAHDRKVPEVRKSNVKVEVENDVSTDDAVEDSNSGRGYKEYAEVVVSRMRKDNRGFDKERYVAILRRKVADAGIDAAAVVNCDEASRGKDSSGPVEEGSSPFRLFLLLCGNMVSSD
jgi:hypothetical protein